MAGRGNSPFRGERARPTRADSAFRCAKWPGTIKPAASSTISSRAKTFSRRFWPPPVNRREGETPERMKVGDKTFRPTSMVTISAVSESRSPRSAQGILYFTTMRSHGRAIRRLEIELQDHQGQLVHRTEESPTSAVPTAAGSVERYQTEGFVWPLVGEKLWTMVPA